MSVAYAEEFMLEPKFTTDHIESIFSNIIRRKKFIISRLEQHMHLRMEDEDEKDNYDSWKIRFNNINKMLDKMRNLIKRYNVEFNESGENKETLSSVI